jgi:hypothetical protein
MERKTYGKKSRDYALIGLIRLRDFCWELCF